MTGDQGPPENPIVENMEPESIAVVQLIAKVENYKNGSTVDVRISKETPVSAIFQVAAYLVDLCATAAPPGRYDEVLEEVCSLAREYRDIKPNGEEPPKSRLWKPGDP